MSTASEATRSTPDSAALAQAETLPDVLAAHAAARPDAVAVLFKRHGIWQSLTWRDLHQRVERTRRGLAALGLRPGEPVALISDPRPGWLVADLAVQATGGISVAVHPTQSENDLRGIFAASPARFAFVGDDEQLELAGGALEGLELCVILDPSFVRRSHEEGSEPLLEFYERADDSVPAAHHPDPDELAIGVISSGVRAVGSDPVPPRTLCFTHRSTIAAARGAAQWLGLGQGDRNLTVVSPAQSTARLADYYAPLVAGSTIAFPESQSTIVENLLEMAPDTLVMTPRALELLAADVELRMEHSGRVKRAANRWAASNRRRSSSPTKALSRALVDRPITSKIGLRRARRVVCAAGQPSAELLRFYWDLGIALVVSYGQAESLGLVSCQRDPGDADTVGPPVPGMEVQVQGGTLHVKSDGLARSYLDGAPAQAPDGWLDTGDHGVVDDGGRLVIHAARQDVLHRPGQPDILLAQVEGRLRLSPYIGEAIALAGTTGVAALIQLELDASVDWALRQGIPGATFAALAASPEVAKLIGDEVEQANASAPEHERVQEFRLLPRRLSVAEDEMTPTLRVRRAVVLRNFEDLADELRGAPVVPAAHGQS
ncbi:MAG TPA: AMP-binding protein [Solirubrobacteraceae bacterium]|nr:AMP-binding protein [Solirubrobacteraceae bacterium]